MGSWRERGRRKHAASESGRRRLRLLVAAALVMASVASGAAWAPTPASAASAPVVTTQPVSLTVNVGGTVSFTAEASGSPTPTVQWQASTDDGASWGLMNGFTSPTLTLAAGAKVDWTGNRYRAVFTNTEGTATSAAAILTVTGKPVMVTQPPTNRSILTGSTLSLSAVAKGAPAPDPQWQVSRDGGATWAPGGDTTVTNQSPDGTRRAELSIKVGYADNGARYRAVFPNAYGSATSVATVLEVFDYPKVATQPVSATVEAGSAATFSLVASGLPAPTVQWQTSASGAWAAIPGATSTSYTTEPLAAEHMAQTYRAIVSNTKGSATSNSVSAWVAAAPVITAQPTSVAVGSGVSFRPEVRFTSGGPATAVWQVSTDGGSTWSSGASQVSPVLGDPTTYVSYFSFLTGGSGTWGRQYRVVISNPSGTVTSQPAVISQGSAPLITAQPQSLTVDSGQTATFTAASSDPTATVQWEVLNTNSTSWSTIAGATASTYTTSVLGPSRDATQYRAAFTSLGGTTRTQVVKVTVQGPPVPGADIDVPTTAGALVVKVGGASGYPEPVPTWEVSGDDGVTWQEVPDFSVTPGRPTTVTRAQIRVLRTSLVRTRWTNSFGTATSAISRITIASPQPLAVSEQPMLVAGKVGDSLSFRSQALATSAPTIVWERRDALGVITPVIRAWSTSTQEGPTGTVAASTFSFTATPDDIGSEFRAVFTLGSDVRASNWAKLTPNAPVVTKDPGVVEVFGDTWLCFGDLSCPPADARTGTFTATAIGDTMTSSWQVKKTGASTWSNAAGTQTVASGVTTAKVVVTGLDFTKDGTQVRAIFTNGSGTATSAPGTASVLYSPDITVPPASTTVAAGQDATFSVVGVGNPTPSVRWMRAAAGSSDFKGIGGETGSTLTLRNVTVEDDGAKVQVLLDNGRRFLSVATATLHVTGPPTMTLQPGPVTTLGETWDCSGGVDCPPAGARQATFAAAAAGAVDDVQWQKQVVGSSTWTDVASTETTASGLTTSVVSLTDLGPTDDGARFRAAFTNPAGSVTTAPALLTVRFSPRVTSQPQDVAVAAGSTATLAVSVAASPVPAYIWQAQAPGTSSWVNVAGGTGPTLDLPDRSLADDGTRYRVVVHNGQRSVAVSDEATVSVTAAPVAEPTVQLGSVVDGQVVVMSFVAVGSPAPSVVFEYSADGVEWYEVPDADVAVVGHRTTVAVGIYAPIEADGWFARARFTNASGSVTTDSIVLEVEPGPGQPTEAPALRTDPADVTTLGESWTCSDGVDCPPASTQTATFTATATGVVHTVRWQRLDAGASSWVDVDGGTTTWSEGITTAALELTGVGAGDDGARFRAVLSNTAGSVTTAPALLTVHFSPVVTSQPQAAAVAAGSTATFAVSATASPAPAYIWQAQAPGSSSWTTVAGVTGRTLVLPDRSIADDGTRFRVVVHNGQRWVAVTDEVTLAVTAAPVADPTVQLGPLVDGQLVTMSFAAVGSPAPSVVFEYSADGVDWYEVPDADVVVDGHRTTVSVEINAPIDADGWFARARFANASGSVTTDPIVLDVEPAPPA